MKAIPQFYSLMLLFALLLLSACKESFLERVDPSAASVGSFFATEDDFTLAMNGVYNVLVRSDYYSVSMWQITDVRSDDGDPGDDVSYVSLFGDAIDNFYEEADLLMPLNAFAASYIGVSRANTLIDRLNTVDLGDQVETTFEAQSRFLRALFYFNLVRLFGDVPMVVSEVTSPDQLEIGRTDKMVIYNEVIIPDLEYAKANLPSSWTSADAGRATKYAAAALLTKVYLTLGEQGGDFYLKARDEALEVIQNGGYSLEPNFADLFKTDFELGVESIFEIQFVSGQGSGYHAEGFGSGVNQPQRTGEGSMFNAFFLPRFQGETYTGYDVWSAAGWGFNIPTTSFDPRPGFEGVPLETGIVEAFEFRDKRRNVTILDYRQDAKANNLPVDESLSPYNVNKYIDWENHNNGESDDNLYLLRLADVYLMFAEAENEVNNGPTTQAYEYINLVRQRAGLPDLASGMSYDEFLTAVYHERRLELAFEMHRWFDLIRRPELAIQTMQAHGKTNITRERLVYAIPQRVVDESNGLITQNPGY